MRGTEATTLWGATGAVFSDCRTYRYRLWRAWDDGPPFVVIGLNPSTADETQDDPTIRRCVGFARREGCGRLVMLNLFALRSTDPKLLRSHPAPIGPDNDRHLLEASLMPGAVVVAAWGAHGTLNNRGASVASLLPPPLRCLGVTKDGHPRHPLYLRADAALLSFTIPSPPEGRAR